MTTIDVIGSIGISLILIAYFLNINNQLDSANIKYILLNLIGASLACLASLLIEYYPFVVLEGTWAAVSVVALIKYLRAGQE